MVKRIQTPSGHFNHYLIVKQHDTTVSSCSTGNVWSKLSRTKLITNTVSTKQTGQMKSMWVFVYDNYCLLPFLFCAHHSSPSSEFKVAIIFTLNTVVQKKKSDEFLVHWTVAPTLPHSRAPTLEITLNHMLICRNEALFQILTIIINILNVSLFSVISAWTLLINHGLWIVTYEPWPMNHRKHLWRNIRVPLVSPKRMNSPLGLIFIANVEQTARIHFYPHYFSHLCSNRLTFIELR